MLCDGTVYGTPHNRDGAFEPQLVKKNQPRITGMDNQILSLYAKGMTTREIAVAFKELYDADVSPALISKVTDDVMEQASRRWKRSPAPWTAATRPELAVKLGQPGDVLRLPGRHPQGDSGMPSKSARCSPRTTQ